MEAKLDDSQCLAAAITKTASKQTYYTIRLFVDRGLVADAFRAYGYYRWVDDVLDEPGGSLPEKVTFIRRQQSLLEALYRGERNDEVCAEEQMLAELVRHDTEKDSGLQMYLRLMMDVMIFDVTRRERVITQAELDDYSRKLAAAVTEAIYYFIGHGDPSPHSECRYLAVQGAHITHMLRDTMEDVANGYYNISGEYLHSHKISPRQVDSPAYRQWVSERIQLAKQYFKAGRECTSQVKNLRCRLAGYAYMARFEGVLDSIERDGYLLRREYHEAKSPIAGAAMGWSVLWSALNDRGQVAA